MNPGGRERFGLGVTNCRSVSQVLGAVGNAESRGAEVAFVAEDINCRDAFQLCALAARATERIRLATGVVNPFTRNPTALAMAAATLDELSGGRAVLGLGTSSPSLIRDQMGIVHARPARVVEEATEIIRLLLLGRSVTYQGDVFRYTDATLMAAPVQQPIPIFFAAMGPGMLTLAGRLADGVLLNVGASTDYIRWAVRQVRRGEADAGRAPGEVTVAAWLTVYVTDDYREGLQRARRWLAGMLSIPRQGELLLEHGGFDMSILPDIRTHVRAYPHGGDPAAAAAFVPDEVADRATLIGTPERVRGRIDEYRSAGVDVPVLPVTAIRALH